MFLLQPDLKAYNFRMWYFTTGAAIQWSCSSALGSLQRLRGPTFNCTVVTPYIDSDLVYSPNRIPLTAYISASLSAETMKLHYVHLKSCTLFYILLLIVQPPLYLKRTCFACQAKKVTQLLKTTHHDVSICTNTHIPVTLTSHSAIPGDFTKVRVSSY